jgi:multiple sugar transport system permease protein
MEAALVDGASRWQIDRFIRLPLLRPLILVALLVRMSDSFKIFDNIYVLTTGGPGRATEVLSLLIYEKNFFFREVGTASAISLIMLAMAIFLSQFFIYVLKRERALA